MGGKEKLIERLVGFGFEMNHKGKTSGSRVRFQHAELKVIIDLHKPHTSGSPVNETTLKNILNSLINNNLIPS